MKYKVAFEARSYNACGIFSSEIVIVEAENEESAKRIAMYALHAERMETRFLIFCEPLKDNDFCLKFATPSGRVDCKAMKIAIKEMCEKLRARK